MLNEDAYREAREGMGLAPCAFEKALLARCASCTLSHHALLAEREVVRCLDREAQSGCAVFKRELHEKALFVLKQPDIHAPLPHARELKLQCGGLQALDRLTETTDVAAAMNKARSLFGEPGRFPYSEMMPDIAAYEPRRRR